MSALEYTVYNIRRGWRMSGTFIFTGAFAAAFACGIFTNVTTITSHRIATLVLFGLWAVFFGTRAHKKFSNVAKAGPALRGRTDLELGLLLVVATHGAVQLVGGLNSVFYPVIFVLIAFLVVYTAQWVGFALVLAAIGIEFALVLLLPSQATFLQVGIHSIFIIFFALINLVFTRTEVARIRKRTDKQIARVKADLADDAQNFRLTSPARGHGKELSRHEEQARLSRASVSALRSAIYHHVDLLKRTMCLHTCAVLWLDTSGEKLSIMECVSDADNLTTRLIGKGEGVVGAILQSRNSQKLKGLKSGYPGLPYYEDGSEVTDFLGIPIVENGNLCGVICADRNTSIEFDDLERETIEASVSSLLNSVATERVFTQLLRAKSEQGKLLGASDSLSKALTEKEVVEAALEAAGQIASFDIAAVALVARSGRQVVAKVLGEGAQELEGAKIGSDSSLVSAALRNKHFLPYRGEFDPKQQQLFGKKYKKIFNGMCSALVLPLVVGEKSIGTLTLVSSGIGAYTEDVRTTLQVMTNQLGTVLQNARMVRRLEEMATTDGLTGLPNHRTFQDELDKKLASATRFNKELSVILCDVDKFKNVNDTYGHPVGDVVLRHLGETLRRNVVRDTDMPARYGGEEFIILCEGTGTEGGVKLAERIRKDLESQVFQTDKGELKVTISMGVASYPSHALTKEDLIERADSALYTAKEGGRNQVRVWEKGMAEA
jgi:diguanylate cyclase (GGDEF)-like protein